MKKLILSFVLIFTSCNELNQVKKINNVLDSLHHLASKADREKYIRLFSSNAVFFGTDINERWPINEFDHYVKSRFDTGVGWSYKKIDRNIFVSKNNKTAWFDEVVENKTYGKLRGTGVLVIENNEWKIAHYNLLLPIPNDYLKKYASEIKEFYEKN